MMLNKKLNLFFYIYFYLIIIYFIKHKIDKLPFLFFKQTFYKDKNLLYFHTVNCNLRKIIFENFSFYNSTLFVINSSEFKLFLYFFYKNISLSLTDAMSFSFYNFNAEFRYLCFLGSLITIDDYDNSTIKTSIKRIQRRLDKLFVAAKDYLLIEDDMFKNFDTKRYPVFTELMDFMLYVKNHPFRSLSDVFEVEYYSIDRKIVYKINTLNLLKKTAYLNLIVKKSFLFYNKKINLLNVKHNIYTFFSSLLSRRLKIFFNVFIRNYLSKEYDENEENMSDFARFIKTVSNKAFRGTNFLKKNIVSLNSRLLNKFSLYYNNFFDKNIFFSLLKNYFNIFLHYTNFNFIEKFKFFLHTFLQNFSVMKLNFLNSDKITDNSDLSYFRWILHFKIKPTKTFYFTLTNLKGEVKFHFSNNYIFNPVKKAKYKVEISKSLRKILLKYLKKNNIFFIHSFYTSFSSKKFVIPLFNLLARNGITIKNIVFYRKIPHSNILKKKLPKRRRI